MNTIFRVVVIPGVVGAGMLALGAPLGACAIGYGLGALCACAGCGKSR